MTKLEYPFTEAKVRELKTGESVAITGRIYTGRDKFHKFYRENPDALEVDLKDGALYHCGPVVVDDGRGGYRVAAAGPTTSVRETPYEPFVIARSGVRIIIGKGGQSLKRTGTQARIDMEDFFQKKVFLRTFVKVDPDWRESKKELRRFGYEY